MGILWRALFLVNLAFLSAVSYSVRRVNFFIILNLAFLSAVSYSVRRVNFL